MFRMRRASTPRALLQHYRRVACVAASNALHGYPRCQYASTPTTPTVQNEMQIETDQSHMLGLLWVLSGEVTLDVERGRPSLARTSLSSCLAAFPMMVPTRLTTLGSAEYSGTSSIDVAIMARKPARCTSCGIVM